MDPKNVDIDAIVQAVLNELRNPGNGAAAENMTPESASNSGLVIDLSDPTLPEARRSTGVKNPHDPDGLVNLKATTTARIAVGRAGSRPKTSTLLLFQADHAITQDAIYGVVEEKVKDQFNLFSVKTMVANRSEYLLRPDLGRRLSEEAKKTIAERCMKNPQVQIVVADGLSAAAINNNLPAIYPVIEQGLKSAGMSTGTPFFVELARVGVINDINDIINAEVVVILLGERPGLEVADAMSAYMGYKPAAGKNDADRDVICMITQNGGTNPLEGGAFVVELIKKTLKYKASGVELKLRSAGEA